MGEHSRGGFLEEVVPEPESRGKAPFQKHRTGRHPHLRARQGPPAKASAQEGGAGAWAP